MDGGLSPADACLVFSMSFEMPTTIMMTIQMKKPSMISLVMSTGWLSRVNGQFD
jgi:hypothetical protein